MNRYRQRSRNSNISPGLVLIGGLMLLAFLVWKFVDGFHKAQQIHELEKQELLDKQTEDSIKPIGDTTLQ